MTTELAPAGDTAAPATVPAIGQEQHLIPKGRLDEEIAKRRALEGDMAAVADAILADVPDHLKALIPSDLGPAAKIRWYQAAKQTGVFSGTVSTVPTTDTRRPATTPRDLDISTLPPMSRMARGYGAK